MGSSEPGQAPESLTGRVTREIGTAIVRGDHPPETTLPVEAAIAAKLGVGRNAVREAVKTLAGKGLLRTGRRAGTIVQPPAAWNLLDPDVLAWTLSVDALRDDLLREIAQLRLMIEPEVAALAATHGSTAEILRLFLALEDMERHRQDPVLAVEADIRFHRCLFAASRHKLVGSLLRAFTVLLQANFDLAVHAPGGFQRNLEVHRAVAEAVHARDPDTARSAMRRLLANNENDLARIMAQRQAGLATTEAS
ncbi:FadR/GntR family transcriptional regulator [Geminicoccus roseus]|uniref:FadR/GntR family transcriptional regulator n=1 Tax=Geminicoccus roseus TaxID=404900 RepID=UPI0004016F99|nr:FadR/GntR family transcriptional regulator [Geminicoccus roseus]